MLLPGFSKAETETPVEFGGAVFSGYADRPVGAEESWYSEAGGFFRLKNSDAVLDAGVFGEWYQRYNRFFETTADNRYSVHADIGASGNRFQWKGSSSVRRSLSAQTEYDSNTGQPPSEYLQNDATTTRRAAGEVRYRIAFSEKSEFIPQYSGFYEEADRAGGNERRVQHEAATGIIYHYSERTGITGEAAVQHQSSARENGETVRIGLGAAWRYSEKTLCSGMLGWMAARYDESGSDQAPYFDLKGTWQAGPKTSFYCFGGTRFRPGARAAGAEQVWRLGYGGDWAPRDTWKISLQLLHQVERSIAGTAGQDAGRSDYVTMRIDKKINKILDAHGSMRYLIDAGGNRQANVISVLGLSASF